MQRFAEHTVAGRWAEAQRFAVRTVAGSSVVGSCWGTDLAVVGDSCAGIGSAVSPVVLPQMVVPHFEAASAVELALQRAVVEPESVGLVPQRAVVEAESAPAMCTVRSIQLLVLPAPPLPVQQ